MQDWNKIRNESVQIVRYDSNKIQVSEFTDYVLDRKDWTKI